MKKRNIFKSLLLCGTMLMAVGCANDYEFNEYYRPTDASAAAGVSVTTGDVKGYGVLAKAEMTVSVPEGSAVQEAGFLYGTQADLDITSDKVSRQIIKGIENGGSTAIALNGLEPGTTYYVQAYAYVAGNLVRGEVKQVTGSNDFERQVTKEIDITDEKVISVNKFAPYGPAVRNIGAPFQIDFLPAIDFTLFNDAFDDFGVPVLEGVANIKVDFTGKEFAALHINAINLGAALVNDYSIGSSYSVYLADAPVTTIEEMQAATLLGSYSFGTQQKLQQETQYDIRFGVTGEKYIVIYSASLYDAQYAKHLTPFAQERTGKNYGLSIDHIGISELVKVEAPAE